MKQMVLIALSAALLATACSKEENAVPGTGTVAFVCEPDLEVEALTRARVQLPLNRPAAALFKLTIAQRDGSNPMVFDPFSTYNQPQLQEGAYTASFELDDPDDVESSTAYCFRGSADFEIKANKTTTATVTPTLANSAIRLKTCEWFDNYYTDVDFTVITSLNNSFHFSPTSNQTIYVKAGTVLRMSGQAVKRQNGVAVAFPERTIGTTQATALHTITVDASQAGGGAIRISMGTVDDMIEVAPIDVELNPEA